VPVPELMAPGIQGLQTRPIPAIHRKLSSGCCDELANLRRSRRSVGRSIHPMTFEVTELTREEAFSVRVSPTSSVKVWFGASRTRSGNEGRLVLT